MSYLPCASICCTQPCQPNKSSSGWQPYLKCRRAFDIIYISMRASLFCHATIQSSVRNLAHASLETAVYSKAAFHKHVHFLFSGNGKPPLGRRSNRIGGRENGGEERWRSRERDAGCPLRVCIASLASHRARSRSRLYSADRVGRDKKKVRTSQTRFSRGTIFDT